MVRFWKLTPLVALSAAVLLLVAAAVLVVYADRDYREQKLNEARVQASILARMVSAPLAFNGVEGAESDVQALGTNPDIVAAAVYDLEGRRIASFLREGAAPLPDEPEVGRAETRANRVGVAVPVVQNNLRLGTVYIRSVTQGFAERLTKYAGLLLLGFMTLIVLAVLGVGQSAVNRANAELARHAEELEEANTKLLQQIAAREKAEEALRQAQKMESIGQLTGGLAHDFNNLLAIILGNLERLERRLDTGADGKQLKNALEAARSGAERAAALTHRLLAFSRRQPLRPESVDVNRLVSGVSELLRRTLGEQIIIETVVAGGLWRVSVDPNQLESTILNLAVNARDAMPDGGKLTIETANAYLDERYCAEHEDVRPGQYVVLCISDTGVGMSKEVMDRAFEPFFTTKDIGHGTGLGLSQVYGLVKQSGGHIKIYSEPGEGTTIKIYLPRLHSDEEPALLEPVLLPEPAPPGHAEAILVVEDDAGVRQNSSEILRELGYAVFEAGDGTQALRVLDEQPSIHLLFTDVGLPGGMNGRQLAAEAERRRPGLRVLYTTGYARNAIVHDGRLDAGVHLITKPFTYAELGEAVQKLLRPAAQSLLVVEDEFLLRASTVENLNDLGCQASAVATAGEARALLESEGGRFSAIIVDLTLPDHKGDGILVELRARWPRLPLIVASGAGPGAVRRELREDPMIVLLPKPYRPSELATALQRLGLLSGRSGRT